VNRRASSIREDLKEGMSTGGRWQGITLLSLL
jgi:hypothetical protein